MGDGRTRGEALLAAIIEGKWDDLAAKLSEMTDVELREMRGDLTRLDQAARHEQWQRSGARPARNSG